MVHCCTAAKYNNRVDRHHLNVPTKGPRRADTTSIDRSARSSERRGRGFESRHLDTATPTPGSTRSGALIAALCSISDAGSRAGVNRNQQTPS